MSQLLLPEDYTNIEQLQTRLHSKAESEWIHRGEERALGLFHEMSRRVPAYKDFLKSRHFSPSSVRSIADFQTIPPVNKDNYLRKYSKDKLCWDGIFPGGQWVISTTSGSTGEPYYFPRNKTQDWQYAIIAELYLRSNFQIQNRSTLYIVAFPMGAWIGGVFTYEALKIVAEHNDYNLSIITPGIYKKEVINIVKHLGDNYDQIIIGAYAPHLKDILDDGEREGVNWKKYNLGFVFSAEAFTEKFRDYVLKTIGSTDALRSTLNHYGTVDLGTMAHETPESIFIRRQLIKTSKLDIFLPEKVRQPTLAQYNPELFYFEEEANKLFCTAYSGIPLVRYDLNDYGGIITRTKLHKLLDQNGMPIDDLLHSAGIHDMSWNLPYVYIYERNDFSVSYYAFQIYPDMIRRTLQNDELISSITGKFSMLVDYDDTGRQHLHIHLEAKHGISATKKLNSLIQQQIHERLVQENSEYRDSFKIVGDVVMPDIHIWPYEHPKYFKSGTKQRWVIKTPIE